MIIENSITIDKYVNHFVQLRKDKNSQNYGENVLFSAPHKPLLLLSVIDLFNEANITENLISLTPDLTDLFNQYWSLVMPVDRHGDISLPFYHLHNEGFWHLKPRPGSESIIASGKRLKSIKQLRLHTLGAQLDDDLFVSMQDKATRELFRAALIDGHFDESARPALLNQGEVNNEVYNYSLTLLENAKKNNATRNEMISRPIRNQAFRKAIVKVYEHTCSFCQISIRTIDSHTIVDAAHITPWSIYQNDDIKNGLALCKLCHWVFDEGLSTVKKDYTLHFSPELEADYNNARHFLNLQHRKLFLPNETAFWPSIESLKWHQKNVFRD